MGVYIKNWSLADWKELLKWAKIGANNSMIGELTEVEEVPPHGRLIDADALRQTMYHEAFETDSPMQKWDSGCWIRYKMFERMEETAPTIIPASEEGE